MVPKSYFESSISRPGDRSFKKGFRFLLNLIFKQDFFYLKTIVNLSPVERHLINDVLDIYFEYLVAAKKLHRLEVPGAKQVVNSYFVRHLQNEKYVNLL